MECIIVLYCVVQRATEYTAMSMNYANGNTDTRREAWVLGVPNFCFVCLCAQENVAVLPARAVSLLEQALEHHSEHLKVHRLFFLVLRAFAYREGPAITTP